MYCVSRGSSVYRGRCLISLRMLGCSRSIPDFGFTFLFVSRELNAAPTCPVDKEVIRPQEVRMSLFGLQALGDEESLSWAEQQ